MAIRIKILQMKKVLGFIVSLIMLFLVVGCMDNTKSNENENQSSNESDGWTNLH